MSFIFVLLLDVKFQVKANPPLSVLLPAAYFKVWVLFFVLTLVAVTFLTVSTASRPNAGLKIYDEWTTLTCKISNRPNFALSMGIFHRVRYHNSLIGMAT